MSIKFDQAPSCYWDNITKVSHLQRRIIVWSILYYEFDTSIIDDHKFDSCCHQLVGLQNELSKKDFDKTTYHYLFENFDGTTGFDLCGRLPQSDKDYLMHIVKGLLEYESNK